MCILDQSENYFFVHLHIFLPIIFFLFHWPIALVVHFSSTVLLTESFHVSMTY